MHTNTDSKRPRIKVALAGLGKMGLSHQAILNMHPNLELVSVCDSAGYLLSLIKKYTGTPGYTDYETMLDREKPDAVVIATPSSLHEHMVREALRRDIHVFCEKPFCLNIEEGARLVEEAERRNLVNQVGYHNRFLATFEEAKNLISNGVIGDVHHVSAECYGPVVLNSKASTWRASKRAGGGCLYDYACHGIDLIQFFIGQPASVRGSTLRSVFSTDAEDEVYANFLYPDGKTARVSANWSDDSFRKMATTITAWGTKGKLVVGRQEINLYLRPQKDLPANLHEGWTTIYTTAITKPVWYYLRGEEYSAQIDHFVQCIQDRTLQNKSHFRSAYATDVVADWIRSDASDSAAQVTQTINDVQTRAAPRGFKKTLSSVGAGFRAFSR
jgi:scyllo-inositol 2-dehydrogenase (NADP+)